VNKKYPTDAKSLFSLESILISEVQSCSSAPEITPLAAAERPHCEKYLAASSGENTTTRVASRISLNPTLLSIPPSSPGSQPTGHGGEEECGDSIPLAADERS
jgi:hypothetical protein